MVAEYGESLTERELEITELVAEGLTNREVAARLFLSPNTVKVHLRNIFTKTGVASRTELSMLAIQEGWITVPGVTDETEEAEASEAVADEASSNRVLPAWPWQRWATLTAGLALAVLILVLPQRALTPVAATGPEEIFGTGGVSSPLRAPAEEERWEELAPLPVRRAGMGVAAHENGIYVIGGMVESGPSDRVDIYHTASDTWDVGSARPVALGHLNAVRLGDQILVPGGCDEDFTPSSVVHLYDATQDTWTEAAPLPTPLCAYALTVYEGQAYLFGGWDGKAYRALAYTYDPVRDTWRSLEAPAQARGFGAAATLGEAVYYVGGVGERREWAICERYVPDTDTWGACSSMLQPRGGLSMVAIGGRLYAIGGGWKTPLAFNERFSPDTDEWSVVDIETPIVGEWRNLGAVAWETSIYVIGGWSADFLNRTYEVEIMPWKVFIPGTLQNQ